MRFESGIIATLLLSLGLGACSDGFEPFEDQVESGELTRELALEYVASPLDVPGIEVRYAEDVPYGEEERNLLDIYLPASDLPTPLVVYIHGGGFTGGDKSIAPERFGEQIREMLQAGVAVAAINYYLISLDPIDEFGVAKSLGDTARALQFLRYYAAALNIDPENVAAFGGSAGAGASLWLGTHDDMADPGNSDPVLRESTRLKAVGAIATQSTYDIMLWEEILYDALAPFEALLGGTDIVTVAETIGATDYLLAFLGLTSVDEIGSEASIAYRANNDMLALMDSGDAPIYVNNTSPDLSDLLNLFLHHGLHALAVHERAQEVGLENAAYIYDPFFTVEDPSGEGLVSFLLRHIN